MRTITSVMFLLLFLVAACSDSGGPGSGGNLTNGNFTASINGTAYTPTIAGVGINGPNLTVVVSGNDVVLSFTTAGSAATTYTFGGATANIASLTTSNSQTWIASPGGGSGTVTISTITGTRVVGTFSFTMAPQSGTGASGNRTVTGSFDLNFNVTY